METSHLADRYIRERRATYSLAPTSARTAAHTLTTFVRAVPADPAKIRGRHVTRWLAGHEVAASTLRTRYSHVRGFTRWLVLNGYATSDPMLGMTAPREPVRLPRALPAADVGALLDQCPDSRARLVVCLMVQLGLRRAEVTGLQVGDVERRDGMILVRGKGRRERWLPLTQQTTYALDSYLGEHPATVGPLIRSYHDDRSPITPDHAGRLVSVWMLSSGVKAGAWDGVAAHALRHTAASDVLDGGAHITDVQAMLGHASLETTQQYLRRPDAARLRVVMEGRRYSPAHPSLLAIVR